MEEICESPTWKKQVFPEKLGHFFLFFFSLKDYNPKERAHTGAEGKCKGEGAAETTVHFPFRTPTLNKESDRVST